MPAMLETPLGIAAKEGDIPLLVNLIRESGDQFDVNAQAPLHEGEFSLLHCALVRMVNGMDRTENRSDMVRLLCAHGANVNAVARLYAVRIDSVLAEFTPLRFCVHAEEAEILLDHGADINFRDSIGNNTALMQSLRYLPLVRLLVRRGADTGGWRRISSEFVKPGVADFLEAVDAAGSYAAYVRAPRIDLVRLRTLCARGRAAPPRDRVLERLFCGPAKAETGARRASKTASSRRPLPNEVFWHILGFWRTRRETGE
jgi:hypothetical protein